MCGEDIGQESRAEGGALQGWEGGTSGPGTDSLKRIGKEEG